MEISVILLVHSFILKCFIMSSSVFVNLKMRLFASLIVKHTKTGVFAVLEWLT